MELLIPGLIIVAVMVWASTRIKRNAAAAFDAEVVETDTLIISKPAGWLSIAEPKNALFEAYTREFAPSPHEEMRLGTAAVVAERASADEIVAGLRTNATIKDEAREIVSEVRYRVLETAQTEGEVEILEFLKIAERDDQSYVLRVRTPDPATAELRRGIETMLDSFILK